MFTSEQFNRRSERISIRIVQHLSGPPQAVRKADVVRILNCTQGSLEVSDNIVKRLELSRVFSIPIGSDVAML